MSSPSRIVTPDTLRDTEAARGHAASITALTAHSKHTAAPRDTRGPGHALARWLGSLRKEAQLTHREIAALLAPRKLCSATSLWRAEQGHQVKWATVEGFTEACGGDLRKAYGLWAATTARGPRGNRMASPRMNRTGARTGGQIAPDPRLINQPHQIIEAMRLIRAACGQPTLRQLENTAKERRLPALPHSTLGDVLRGLRMPSKSLFSSFIRVCDVPAEEQPIWEKSWERANQAYHCPSGGYTKTFDAQEVAQIVLAAARQSARTGQRGQALVDLLVPCFNEPSRSWHVIR